MLNIQGKQYACTGRLVRLLRLRDEFVDDFGDPEKTISEIRRTGLSIDLITFLQRPPEVQPRFDYHMEWDNLAVLELTTYDHWFHGQVHQNTRNKIRKSEKAGIDVRIESFTDALAHDLVELFNETPIRRGRVYPYYGWNVDQVRQGWATDLDRSTFVVAYLDSKLVGFIKLVRGDQLMRTSGTVARLSYRRHAPMNALISKAVEICASEKCPLLVYGHFTYERKGEDSLASFKRYNGFKRVDAPRYYVPVSLRGSLALGLRLHRGVGRLLPQAFLQLAGTLRSRWYERGGRLDTGTS